MKIGVFTSNQPRHLALCRELAAVADTVYVIQEATTIFPGRHQGVFRKSEVMERYFANVRQAELDVFGKIGALPTNVRQIVMQIGDAALLSLDDVPFLLDADYYVVFGASYLKGDIADFLISRRAVNIHMGISPYYRGSSCNFWALYDQRPEFVGATIHLLSAGLDSGDILYHAFPGSEPDPFRLGMRAVEAAHNSLRDRIANGTLFDTRPVKQDRSLQLRYTRGADFTDEIAAAYLDAAMSAGPLPNLPSSRKEPAIVRPYFLADEGP